MYVVLRAPKNMSFEKNARLNALYVKARALLKSFG
jgi:hypothetical protein